MANEFADQGMPSMQFVAPSGIQVVGPSDQVNAPVAAQTGAVVQQSQQMLSGSDKNTPPGPPIFKWNKYDLCWNAYWGTGGFYDGTVLRKMLVELDDQYLLRRALTFYRNFFRHIIDSTYKPVFSEGVTRTTKVNDVVDEDGKLAPFWDAFQDDVDHRHHSIGQFTKQAVKNARILGVCFVVVDNFPEFPELAKDALKDRKFPYVYVRLPQQVEEKHIILDEFCRIQQIIFRESPEEVVNKEGQTELEKRWKKWTPAYSVKLRMDKDNGQFVEIASTKVEYNLGEVPVIPVMSSETEGDTVLPHPTFYDLCRCNWAIFNWDSFEARTICASMYPVLTLPRPSGTEVSNLQAMSPQQGLFVPPAENGTTPAQPRWLDYPVTCFEAVDKYIQTLIDDLFRQSGQAGVTPRVKQGTGPSGLSKSYDFQAQHYILKESSKMAKCCEREVARIFQLYVTSEKFDYEVHYEEDFGPDEDPDQDVKLYGDYLALQPGPKAKALAMKMLAHSIFDDAEEDDLQEVIKEIDEELLNEQKDKTDIPPPDQVPPVPPVPDQGQPPASPSPPVPPKTVKKGPPKRGFSVRKKGVAQ